MSLIVENNIYVNKYSQINITIYNTGGASAGSFSVRLFDGTTQIGKYQSAGLAAGESTPYTFNWKPTTTGLHELKVILDQANLVAESNENNNEIVQTINVGSIDLTPINLQVPVHAVINQDNVIIVSVKNIGLNNSGSFSVRLFDGTTQIGKYQSAGLAAGENIQYTFNWKPTTTGTHELKVILDQANLIVESNETNNEIIGNSIVST